MTLGFYEDSKSNNFTLVRIIAALSVLFCHSFAITGYKTDPLTWIIQKLHFSESSGKLAVCIFFSISGFLITASYTKSSKSRFLAARFLRLYPAILIYSLFAILVIGPLNIEVPLSKYFSANPWENLWNTTLWSWKYNLPYAFSNNIIQGSTNGSTWTLPLELRCYLVTFAIGCMSGFTYKYLYFVITILMIWIIITNPSLSFMGVDSKRSITPFLFYITGSLFWIFRHNIPLKWSVAIGLYLCDFFLHNTPFDFYFHPIVITYALLMVVYVLPALDIHKLGDISYGMYIYAWPVQQSVFTHGQSGLMNFSFAILIVIPLAWISWNLVEKPAINLKKFFKKTNHVSPHSFASKITAGGSSDLGTAE